MSWIDRTGLGDLPPEAKTALARLSPMSLPKGAAVFHPGQPVDGFVVVLSGRIEVYLVGPTGRDILLYAVEPGQSCVQTTLGLMGGDPYTGEAIATRDCEVVMIPRSQFLSLMNSAATFREFVFRAFADRMKSTMHVLEKVAFQKIESRLAEALLDLAVGDAVRATQSELASRIGSAREVISRRLESFERRGWVTRERGHVTLCDTDALRRLVKMDSAT